MEFSPLETQVIYQVLTVTSVYPESLHVYILYNLDF